MHRPRILIIEDEETLAKAIRKYLEANGSYDIDWAADGKEGLEKIDTADIILLDIVLPKTDGMMLLHKIRNTPAYHNKKVIMLTNLDRDSDKSEAKELGAVHYLVKSTSSLESICNIITSLADEVSEQAN